MYVVSVIHTKNSRFRRFSRLDCKSSVCVVFVEIRPVVENALKDQLPELRNPTSEIFAEKIYILMHGNAAMH